MHLHNLACDCGGGGGNCAVSRSSFSPYIMVQNYILKQLSHPPALSVSPSNDVTITRLLQLLSPSPPPLPLMTRDIYLPTSMFGILEMMAERLQGAALFVAGVTGMCASLGTRRTSHVIIRFPPSRRYLESPSPPSPLLLLPPRRHIVAEKRRQKRGVSACNQRPCSGENTNRKCSLLLALIISSSISNLEAAALLTYSPPSTLDRLSSCDTHTSRHRDH